MHTQAIKSTVLDYATTLCQTPTAFLFVHRNENLKKKVTEKQPFCRGKKKHKKGNMELTHGKTFSHKISPEIFLRQIFR